MNFEVEKKISVRDHELIKSILDELCVYRDHSIKNDIYFAHETVKDPDFKKDKIFRIRECVDNTFVTYKFKKIEDGAEINMEHEFGVQDNNTFIEFVQYLGFMEFIRKSKESDVFKYNDLTVELSFIKDLGYFLEVEAICSVESEVAQSLKKLDIFFNTLYQEVISSVEREKRPVSQVIAFENSALIFEERYYIEMLQEIA
ncbi:MAG: class IV adenylate cyclase [Actinomycetia bacterium]|nr:class IV adenylate cyclase [Actinomycetes bacterium]